METCSKVYSLMPYFSIQTLVIEDDTTYQVVGLDASPHLALLFLTSQSCKPFQFDFLVSWVVTQHDFDPRAGRVSTRFLGLADCHLSTAFGSTDLTCGTSAA